MMDRERETDLRVQHEAFGRAGYDGHNRKPQPFSMRHLRLRRWRRRTREGLRRRVGWMAATWA